MLGVFGITSGSSGSGAVSQGACFGGRGCYEGGILNGEGYAGVCPTGQLLYFFLGCGSEVFLDRSGMGGRHGDVLFLILVYELQGGDIPSTWRRGWWGGW